MMLAVLLLAACASGPVLTPVQKADQERWARGPATGLEVGGTLVVLNKAEASASLVDCRSGSEVVRLLTGTGPHEVAVSPDGRSAVVCNYGHREPGNTLTVIDVAAGRVSRTIDLGEHLRPHGIQFFPDGRTLAVTAEMEGAVLIVDAETGAVLAAIPTEQEGSHMLVLSSDGARIYVANIRSGTVTAIDAAAKQVIKVVPAGEGAEGIDVSPDGAAVWVANRGADTITVIDAQSLEAEDTLPCGQSPIRLKFTPEGARVLVSNAGSGDIAVFDVLARREERRIRMSAALMEQAKYRMPQDTMAHGPMPIGVLIEPQGRLAFAACSGADAVAVIDLGKLKDTGVLPAGIGPDGLGWSPMVVGEGTVASSGW
jgi:YVTN family beta-propeller protein